MLVAKGYQGASAEVRTSLYGPLPASWTPLSTAKPAGGAARKSRPKKDLAEDLESKPPSVREPYRKFKEMLSRRGTRGIFSLGRLFRIIDDDRSGSLSLPEFKKAMRDFRVDLEEDETEDFFAFFDKDHNGTISYDEFLVTIRGDLNAIRREIVSAAFDKFDVTGDGQVSIDDLRGVYDASKHPLVVQGKKDPEEVLLEFLDTFDTENKDGIVTRDEFIRYYANVSASIDEDIYFVEMVKRCWKLDREYQREYQKGGRMDLASEKRADASKVVGAEGRGSGERRSSLSSSAAPASETPVGGAIGADARRSSKASTAASSSDLSPHAPKHSPVQSSSAGSSASHIASSPSIEAGATDAVFASGSIPRRSGVAFTEASPPEKPKPVATAWSSGSVQLSTAPAGAPSKQDASPFSQADMPSVKNPLLSAHRRRSQLTSPGFDSGRGAGGAFGAAAASGAAGVPGERSEPLAERPRLTTSQIRTLIESQLSNPSGKTYEDLFLVARKQLGDGDLRLDTVRLETLLKALGIFNTIGAENLARLTSGYAVDDAGTFALSEFIDSVRKPINERRRKIVEQAFDKLDAGSKGYATASDIRAIFNAKYEKDVRCGKLTDEAALKQIISKLCGTAESGVVTRERFRDYYYCVSGSIDDDNYFLLLVWNAWNLSGSKTAKKKTSDEPGL